MKKMNLIIACSFLVGGLASCGSENGTGNQDATTTADTNMRNADSACGTTSNSTTSTGANTTTTTANAGPLNSADSAFVMKAAVGGMLEVQSGTTAQQNGMNERVKGFGTMLVNDHTKANSELMAIASSRGITPPADLPADKKKHLTDMAKMKGKSFDNHFITMMNADHKKDVELFEKQANSGTDPELKAFAAKTLPVLKMHLDSAQALSKMKM
jgi:putative membrane protein